MSAPEPPQTPVMGVDAITDAPPARVGPEAQAATAAEREALRNALIEEQVKDREQDRQERERYAGRIYRIIVGWLVWLSLVVMAQGFRFLGFDLPEAVLIALVGSTTATVIGVFLIVTNYLFPRDSRDKRDERAP